MICCASLHRVSTFVKAFGIPKLQVMKIVSKSPWNWRLERELQGYVYKCNSSGVELCNRVIRCEAQRNLCELDSSRSG